MPTSIVKYTKSANEWTDIVMRFPDSTGADDETHCTELCTLDGVTYVAVPDNVTLPEQPPEITVEPVTLTPELIAAIREASQHCAFIDERRQMMIRSRYSIDDEQYMNRLCAAHFVGATKITAAQLKMTREYHTYIEQCIAWAKAERAKLGL